LSFLTEPGQIYISKIDVRRENLQTPFIRLRQGGERLRDRDVNIRKINSRKINIRGS
jgi:hypothetical protein